jgi:amidase
MTPFEVGTDLAGSIRIPAHFCGVFGFKPTEKRVSLEGVVPGIPAPRSIRMMSCVGPLARGIDDLALIYKLIAGPDGLDTEVAPVPVDDMPEISLKGLRVAYAPTFPGLPVAKEIQDALAEVARKLAAAGAVVEEAPLPQMDYGQALSSAGELIGMMLGAFQPESDQPPATLAQYLSALHGRDQAIIAWEQFFSAWDVLLCPPSMTSAFNHRASGRPISVNGEGVIYWMGNGHTTLFNYTGHPALVMPYKQNQMRMPIGVQLVGKRWDDSRLLGIGKAVTAITGAFQCPPGY